MKIPGLVEVFTPNVVRENPGGMRDDEIVEAMRFFGPGHDAARVEDLDEDTIAQLLIIQKACQQYHVWGRNRLKIGLEDFKLEVIATDPDGDGSPVGFIDAGLALVVKHKETGNVGNFDLFYPSGFSGRHGSGSEFPNGARQTASQLIKLGTPG